MTEQAFTFVHWDGRELSTEPRRGARRLRVDRRCVEGEPVAGAFAHVCALPDRDARIPYDQPEVQAVRRDALAWWIPLLGDEFVCLSTFAVDSVHCAGAVTVARTPERFADDPFARLFPGTTVETGAFSAVAAPVGPVIERYSGAPWPGGSFG